jgi:hypothetical protein
MHAEKHKNGDGNGASLVDLPLCRARPQGASQYYTAERAE